MNKCLAVITARGGSKRIPRKNIKLFCDKPVLSYPINAAIDSKLFETIIVSTDDYEIAEVGKKLGASIPFMRSEENSNDFATTSDVIEEVLSEYKKRLMTFEYVCCIYPAAVFVNPQKLQNSYHMLVEEKYDSVIPIVRFGHPIQRALKIENNILKMINPNHLNTRSQDLPPSYHDAAQFYWLNTKSFLSQKKLFMDNTGAFEIPELEVQDIDNEVDWALAEIKYQKMKKN
ncbi:MAG: pseudaminic acid cytidylyltransferase [Oligoflexia bacterium]|nr:pseudaminic acid cytidylyltransferase [Oligoflexia bacterium]